MLNERNFPALGNICRFTCLFYMYDKVCFTVKNHYAVETHKRTKAGIKLPFAPPLFQLVSGVLASLWSLLLWPLLTCAGTSDSVNCGQRRWCCCSLSCSVLWFVHITCAFSTHISEAFGRLVGRAPGLPVSFRHARSPGNAASVHVYA